MYKDRTKECMESTTSTLNCVVSSSPHFAYAYNISKTGPYRNRFKWKPRPLRNVLILTVLWQQKQRNMTVLWQQKQIGHKVKHRIRSVEHRVKPTFNLKLAWDSVCFSCHFVRKLPQFVLMCS